MVDSSPTTRSGRLRLWIVVSVVALVLRVALLPIGPKYGYWGDHDDFVRWGIQAADEGVLSLYDHPPARQACRVWDDGKWKLVHRSLDRLCNYPPLSAYLLWGSGKVFVAVSDDRIINTTTSRAVFASWVIVGDFVLALGCASLVRFYGSRRAAWWAYVIALFAPPLWWDSVVWGQVDTVALAPAVWMIRAMVAKRWVWAGVAYGILAALKPQAILFIPVWGLAVLITKPFSKPLLSLLVAGVVLVLSSLPFTFHSGWTWFHSSYVANLVEAYKFTSMGAFNLWYVDLLLCDSLDSQALWHGVAKDTWGRGLLIAGMALTFGWMLLRWRRDPRSLLLWSSLVLLLVVMLPTRVHERYLLWMLPFAIASAMLWPRLWPGCLLLLVVATAQVTWPVWMKATPGQWPQRERRVTRRYMRTLAETPPAMRDQAPKLADVLKEPREKYRQERAQTENYEWLFTILGLLAAALTIGAVLSLKPTASRGPPASTWQRVDER